MASREPIYNAIVHAKGRPESKNWHENPRIWIFFLIEILVEKQEKRELFFLTGFKARWEVCGKIRVLKSKPFHTIGILSYNRPRTRAKISDNHVRTERRNDSSRTPIREPRKFLYDHPQTVHRMSI